MKLDTQHYLGKTLEIFKRLTGVKKHVIQRAVPNNHKKTTGARSRYKAAKPLQAPGAGGETEPGIGGMAEWFKAAVLKTVE